MKATAVDGAEVLVVDRDGRQHRVWVATVGAGRWAFCDGDVWELQAAPEPRSRRRGGVHESLSAPMPATVVRIPVATGDQVQRGQTVLVLEAMKMELPLRAAHDGTVTAVRCREGELVQPGATLVEIE